MQELWLPVVGYEGLYEVSDQGRVRSLERTAKVKGGHRTVPPRTLALARRGGYRMATLSRDGKQSCASVHRLVAAAFLGPCPLGMIVLHGELGSANNSLANLRYGTQAENMADKYRDGTEQTGERHGKSKLTESEVLEIRSRAIDTPLRQLAREYCVSQRAIQWVVKRRCWAHLP